MKKRTRDTAFGCLLHDVGKIVYRSQTEQTGTHSEQGYAFLKGEENWAAADEILSCVRYHHGAELKKAGGLAPDSVSYIAYIADNIAAAADRREVSETGNFEKYAPMVPVFSRLNGEHKGYSLPFNKMDGTLRMPVKGKIQLTNGQYNEALAGLRQGLRGIEVRDECADSLLSLLEAWTSSLPSSTYTGELPDISLYDHLRITAAVGTCICEYLDEKGVRDLKTALLEREAEFYDEKAFLLYSADFSGIQRFIYTVTTTHALKALRSRSFFLEIGMEHYIDELLAACGVSRANLIYSGGGHCYILLPNTAKVKEAAAAWNAVFNQWLMEEFGAGLYLADGIAECSGNALMNRPAAAQPYKAVFRQVSSRIAEKKNARYTAGQIRMLNGGSKTGEQPGRECAVCGRIDHLTSDSENRCVCRWCRTFENLSGDIQSKKVVLVTDTDPGASAFALPAVGGTAYFSFYPDENAVRGVLGGGLTARRLYTKNMFCTGMNFSTPIYVGDYAKSNQLRELSESSAGISRLGVCRMDVDDLGQAFVAGFEQAGAKTAEEKNKFVTLSRTAAFSRQMSLFFKCYLNGILSGAFGGRSALDTAVVYSGGDDVFLVGAWNDVIEAASRIRAAFQSYSCGALTISGGIAVLEPNYPIRLAAQRAAELEDEAKSRDGKNGIAFFDAGSGHCYGWDEYSEKVIGEKKRTLEDFFDREDNERGMSFLYRLTELLREAQKREGKTIHLARFAYLLARMEPRDAEKRERFREFSKNMYAWALDRTDRGQLITAIYIYVYENRKRSEG